MEHGRRAAAPRAEQDVPDRLRPARCRPCTRRGRPASRRASARPARASPSVYAVRVHDALRILRRAGRVEDEAPGPRRAVSAVSAIGVAELGLAGVDDLGRLRPSPRSRRASRGPRRAGRRRSDGPGSRGPCARSISEHGIATAPAFSPASITRNQSGVLPIRTSTRSPGATPRSRSSPAQRAASVRHLAERQIPDIAVLVAETNRELAGILRLDDVPGEVESRRSHRGSHRHRRRARCDQLLVGVRLAPADGQPPASAHHTALRDDSLAGRGLEEVDLVLDRQHVDLLFGSRIGRVAARAVEHGRHRSGVEKTVLLGEAIVERKLEIDLAGCGMSDGHPERRHERLRRHGPPDALEQVVPRREASSRTANGSPWRGHLRGQGTPRQNRPMPVVRIRALPQHHLDTRRSRSPSRTASPPSSERTRAAPG